MQAPWKVKSKKTEQVDKLSKNFSCESCARSMFAQKLFNAVEHASRYIWSCRYAGIKVYITDSYKSRLQNKKRDLTGQMACAQKY